MNIILIGMPGCGKSTVGRLAAQQTGRDFFETDALIEEAEGRAISDIFAAEGEAYFRAIESLVAADVATVENAVISTGGGMVLRPENMRALAAKGKIFFIDRTPEDIAGEDHEGRPLLAGKRERVFELYTQRIELYQKYAQYIIKSGPEVEDTLGRLLDAMEREGLL